MKRWIRLGAAVAVVAVLVVALVLLRAQPERPAEADAPDDGNAVAAQTDERATLLQNPTEEIARVRVQAGENELEIVRTDSNTFQPVYEYDVEFNDRGVSRIVSAAASLSSRRTIGEVDDLSEYGLTDPSATVTVTRDDGTQQRIIVGARTPARDGFYVVQPDDPNVYTVFSSWITPFFSTLDELRVRTIPQISFEQLERVAIDTLTGRRIRVSKVPEWDDDPELGFAMFAVTEPFTRRFQANQNWFEELNTQLGSLRIGRFVDDAPADLAAYGLAPPQARIAVADREKTLDLLVGAQTKDGRFAKFAETPSVFVLSGADPIVTVRPYETVSAFALILNIDLVDSFAVETQDATYRGSIERTPVEGEEEPEATYYLNGTEIEEDLFKDLYQWAIGMQFDAELDQATTDPTQLRDPMASITYNLNNEMGPLSVSFVPENANFAVVVREGVAEFLISRAKVQRMIATFETAAAELAE